MKSPLTLVVVFILLLSAQLVLAQTTNDYQSNVTGSGNWSSLSSWQRWDGDSWETPTPGEGVPNSSDGVISILAGDQIDMDVGTTVDQVVINASGGNLRINQGITMTVADGSGTDIQINGTLTMRDDGFFTGSTMTVIGQIVNAGTFTRLAGLSPVTFNSGSSWEHAIDGTALPAQPNVTWNSGSTCLITGVVSSIPANMDQNFHDFTWNCTSQSGTLDFGWTTRTMTGDVTITDTNAAGASGLVAFNLSGTGTVTINGNLNVESNSRIAVAGSGSVSVSVDSDFSFNPGAVASSFFSSSGDGTLNVKGAYSFSSGTLSQGTTANINFNGGVSQNYSGGGTYSGTIDIDITNASTLLLGSNSLSTNGTFTVNTSSTLDTGTGFIGGASGSLDLNNGSTLRVGSAAGLVDGTGSGAIRMPTANRTFTAGATIVYNGSIAQVVGDGFPSVAIDLEIDNSAGVTNDNIGTTNLLGDLILTSGSLVIGDANTLDIQSNLVSNGGTISGSTNSNLTFSGSGTISGTPGTLDFTTGSQTLLNFTIDRTASIPLGTDLDVQGILLFNSSANLEISGVTLTISELTGDIDQALGQSGALNSVSGNPGNLDLQGTGALSDIPICGSCGSQALDELTFNRGGGTYTWNGSVTVNNNLNLNNGALTHTSGLNMGSGSNFNRTAGGATISSVPTATTTYNVSYSNTLTTGSELPTVASGDLNNLSVAGDATLDKAIDINGNLTINSGTLAAGANNVTLSGSSFTINAGTFTINSANTFTLDYAGTTTMSGAAFGGTQFGNLTIITGTTVSAPNANLNVSGTWNNGGTFTPNSGTITFNGASQNINPSGQPFNNVDFAGTGSKTLQGALDVNGTLTISALSTLDVGSNQSINVAGTWTNSGSFVPGGGTVTFDGVTQTITSAGQPFYNLTLSNSGTKTLGDALDANGAITIDNGVTLDIDVSGYAINLAGGWTNNGTFNERTGTVTFDGTTAIAGSATTDFFGVTIAGTLTATAATTNVAGNWLYSSGTFNNNGGTIDFNGGTNQNITSGGQIFNNVTISGLNTKILQDDIDINGNLTLTSGTFDVGTDRAINIAGNWDASGGGIFTAAAGKVVFDGITQSVDGGGETFHDIDLASTTTATFSGDLSLTGDWNAIAGSAYSGSGTTSFIGGTQSITNSSGSFGNVTIAGTLTKTLQDALDVNGDLTISSTLDVGTNYAVNVSGDWDSGTGNFTPATGTVTLDGTGQSITSGSNAFNILVVAGTASKTLQDALDVNNNLTISSTLDVGTSQAVNIVGDWTNNGTFTAASGKVTFDGGGTSNVLGSATTAFNDIDITGNTAVEIETTHNLSGTLSLVGSTSGFDADGSGDAGVFTLVSSSDDPSTDGNIAAITTPANFIGNVTVQRYMSSEGKMWRYLTTPVSGQTVAQWQAEFPITGGFTGADDLGGSNLASLYIYNELHTDIADSGWVAYPVAANTESITPGVGYSAYIRASGGQTTLDQRGPINKGDFPFTVNFTTGPGASDDGWNLLGNPYPAALDWDLLYADPGTSNINSTIYIKDNGGGGGVYATYTAAGSGTNGGTKNIGQGQSFWVHANLASPTLTAKETMKTTGTHEFFRIESPVNYLRIALNDGVYKDETLIHFFDDAQPGKDKYDAYKLQNDIFNLSTLMDDGKEMVVNAIGSTTCDSEVSLKISNISAGNYTLDFSELDSFEDVVAVYLTDNFINTYNSVSNGFVYPFSVTADAGSYGAGRFKVSFDKPDINTSLIVSTNDICEKELPKISIAASELGVKYFALRNGIGVSDTLSGNGNNLEILVLEDSLTFGTYQYNLIADNSCGSMTLTNSAEVSVEEIFAISQVVGDQACGDNTTNLQAVGAPDNGSYRWYNEQDDVLPLAETIVGNFTTPVISESHVFFVAAVNQRGCEGERIAIQADITKLTVPLIELDSIDHGVYQLISNYTLGNQWFRDGLEIDGAVSNTLIVTEPGIYSVSVTQSGCSISSDEYDYDDLVTGINEEFDYLSVTVAPNPFVNSFEVNVSQDLFNLKKTEITIYDINGRVMYFNKKVKSENISINLGNYNNGIYLMNIYDGNKGVQRKLVKE